MSFNWDNIKYLFQIPLEWFKAVHNRIFKAYGTNFIIVKEGDEGEMHIDVDEDLFANQVQQVQGFVKSVDGKTPDANGDVSFELTASKWVKTDSNGHLTTSNDDPIVLSSGQQGYVYNNNGTVEYIDDEYVDLSSTQSAAGQKTWEDNAHFEGIVYVQNPDASSGSGMSFSHTGTGQSIIQLNGGANGSVVALNYPSKTHGRLVKNNQGLWVEDDNIILHGIDNLLMDVPQNMATLKYSPNTSADNTAIATVGWTKNELTNYVKTVNNIQPDTSGNVNISVDTQDCLKYSDYNTLQSRYPVASLIYNNIRYTGTIHGGLNLLYDWVGAYNYNTLDDEISDLGYVKNNELTAYVKSVDNISADINGNVELTGVVRTVDDISADINGNVELTGVVRTVDDIEPDEDGNVSFGLAGSKWVKTDADGYLDTTDDVPIVLSTGTTGYVFNNNGTVEYKNEQYVDLSTAQVAAGQKTWKDNAYFNSIIYNINPNASSGSGIAMSHSNGGQANISLNGGDGGAVISLHKTASTTSQILKGSNATWIEDGGLVVLSAGIGANIDAPVNMATLQNEPNNNATSKSIATVGWCNRKLSSYVKTVNSTAPDANGNVNISIPSISACVLTSDINDSTTQGRIGVAGYYYANIVYTGTLPGGVSYLFDWVGAYNYNTLDDEIADLGYLKEDDLGDLAFLDKIKVDGHDSNSSGEVSFGLTGSKWVTTDVNGHLTTTNATPISVDTTQYTPVTSNFDVVAGVTWNGTKLQYTKKQLNFVNGVLVNVGNAVTVDIDTAVTYNP